MVIDSTFVLNNPLRFRSNLSKRMWQLIIRLEIKKLQYDFNIEAVKISALSSGEIDKYEYLTGKKILPPDQKIVIEQTKLTYSLLGKAFGKEAKMIDNQERKKLKL